MSGMMVLPTLSFEDLPGVARADYLAGRIDLDEFERRTAWLLRNPGRWPDWVYG